MYSYLTVNEPSHREIGNVCRFSLQRNVARPDSIIILDGLTDVGRSQVKCDFLSILVMWQTRWSQ
jgi:hypothetical protein